jgi:ABC-2 type transport system ATP-binding protein
LPRPPPRPAGGACAVINKGAHNEVSRSIRYMGGLYSYSMGTMLFEVQGLSKRFGRIQALTGVTFHVRAGEVLGLIGPNGAGKSTLFECLAGVLPMDSGQILPARERSSLLFYVPDGIAPWPAQSVRWALEFTIGFLGGRANLHDEIVDQMDLRPLLDQPMGTLSKGQRKRALLAIGLLTAQPALLIDEPFEGLDLRQARDIAVALRAHAARGRTLFLSIHQISDAARFCDRFVLLNSGRVRGEGTVEELAALAHQPSQNLEEVFLALT